jgi:hypothetical protein
MAWKVIPINLDKEEVIETEEEADALADHYYRVQGIECRVIHCSDNELPKKLR